MNFHPSSDGCCRCCVIGRRARRYSLSAISISISKRRRFLRGIQRQLGDADAEAEAGGGRSPTRRGFRRRRRRKPPASTNRRRAGRRCTGTCCDRRGSGPRGSLQPQAKHFLCSQGHALLSRFTNTALLFLRSKFTLAFINEPNESYDGTQIQPCFIEINGAEVNNAGEVSPSSFMPVFRHFSKRQAGHFFRVAMVTGQAAPRRQT